MYVGIDESTGYRWIQQDTSFASDIQEARSLFIQDLNKRVKFKKPDFLLERLIKEEYSQNILIGGDMKLEIELTTKDTPPKPI